MTLILQRRSFLFRNDIQRTATACFLWALSLFPLRADLILNYDVRSVRVSRGQEELAPASGARWTRTLEVPFVSAGSGETTGQQTAQQSSYFSQFRVQGEGSATTTYTPGHPGNGAEADSDLEFRFTVTKTATFRFTGSCYGNQINDNLRFTGPSPLGTIANINSANSVTRSGTLVPGNYIIEANCHTQASDARRNGGWAFELHIGPPPSLVVEPWLLDFGPVHVHQEKTLTLAIQNGGPADSVLAGTIYAPINVPFKVAGAPLDFEVKPGQPLLVEVTINAPLDAELFKKQLNTVLQIRSGDPNNSLLLLPMTAFVKMPEPIDFRKLWELCVNPFTHADRLPVRLMWDSSTGYRSDLAGITIHEVLTPTFGWVADADLAQARAPAPFVLPPVARAPHRGAKSWPATGRDAWPCAAVTSATGVGRDLHEFPPYTSQYVESSFGVRQEYYWTAPWQTEPVLLLTDEVKWALTPVPALGATYWYEQISSTQAGDLNTLADFSLFRHAEINSSATARSFVLRYAGEPGKVYRLQRAQQSTGPWETIHATTLPSVGNGALDFADTNLPPTAAFYRLLGE